MAANSIAISSSAGSNSISDKNFIRLEILVDINKLSLLGNCANRNNYSYSEEDVRKMMDAIKQSLKETEMRFMSEVRKGGNKRFNF